MAKEAKAAQKGADTQASKLRTAKTEASTQVWLTWLVVNALGKRNTFLQIDALGGYDKAREMFVADGGEDKQQIAMERLSLFEGRVILDARGSL